MATTIENGNESNKKQSSQKQGLCFHLQNLRRVVSHQIDNLLEVDRHLGLLQVAVVGGVVDQLRHLVQSQLLGTLAEHKQHSINNIGLSTTVWSHYRGEALQEKEVVST